MRAKFVALAAVVAAAVGVTPAAQAADIPAPVYKARQPIVAPAFNWSGMYLGAHVGWGFSRTEVYDPFAGSLIGFFLGLPETHNFNGDGVLAGGQVGANYQIGQLVVGTEFEGSWANVNGTSTVIAQPFLGDPFLLHRSSKYEALLTSAARTGFAWNQWLLYGKAGAAFARIRYHDYTDFAYDSSKTSWETGWLVGGGLEWAFMNNWSAKLEYQFIDFGHRNINLTPVGPFSVVNQVDETLHTVKFGVNYRFSSLGL